MSKAEIYTVNSASTVAQLNTPVSLGTIVRRYGDISSDGISVIATESGYYDIDLSVTFTSATTGDITFTIYQNGVPITGATATETVSLATTQVKTMSISTLARVMCRANGIITVEASGVVPTISNISLRVKKS